MFLTEKQLEDNPDETVKVLKGEVELELQAHVDQLMAESEKLNKELASKQEQVCFTNDFS